MSNDLAAPAVVTPDGSTTTTTPVWLTPEVDRAIRRAWFATSSSDGSAISLGVSADRVIDHLRGAGQWRRFDARLAGLLHLADLSVAIACIDGRAEAWCLLRGQCEAVLCRAAEPFRASSNGVVRARRLLVNIERASLDDTDSSLNLRRYLGVAPLKSWAVERLMGSIALDLAGRRSREEEALQASAERLRSAMSLIHSGRLQEAKQVMPATWPDTTVDPVRVAGTL